MCFTATMLMGKKMKTFRGGVIGCWRSRCSSALLLQYYAVLRRTNNFWIMHLELRLHAWELIVDLTFFRDFMHIVLVHYLEVKVIPNPTLVDMYFASISLFETTGFHYPKCCIVEKIMLNFVLACCVL